MRTQLKRATIFVALVLSLQSAAAAGPTTPKPAPSTAPENADATTPAERVNTEAIKEKYWARGDEAEIGVVQNRLYSKARKVEFQLIGGIISSDPFVSTYSLGGRLGYHFNEYFSAHLLVWKSWASPSNAQTVAASSAVQIGTAFNTDYAKSYYGPEFQASLLYGKLSLIGQAIIYYDLHFLAGLGETSTESGNNFTQSVGIGQQFWVSKTTSIIFDYRLMHYRDTLLNKTVPSQLGQPAGTRTNWSNSISLGFGFLFGSGK